MTARLKANEKVHSVDNNNFTLDRRYSDLKLIGRGSYGVVVKAKDAVRGINVAIKKVTPMAKTVMDAKHVLREVRIMRHMGNMMTNGRTIVLIFNISSCVLSNIPFLGKHENIITLEDLIVREAADELYIVMELFDSDLHLVIQSSQVRDSLPPRRLPCY